MNKKHTSTTESAAGEFSLHRRNLLQRVALISGVFVSGVFRLDHVFANVSGESTTTTEACCNLLKNHDPNCKIGSCTSSLYWVCLGGNYMYRCVECLNVDHGADEEDELTACWAVSLSDVKCSRAIHPKEADYAVFD